MARGRSRGVGCWVCILLPAIFKNVVNVYNFFIILNHLDSDNPYALSTHNRKCANKIASYLVKHSELGSKNLNKICLKIIQKALK